MLRRFRENGPGLLVPAAWTVVALAHADAVGRRPLLIAHVVMDVVIVAFAALSWSEMTEGVLLAWKYVLVVGILPTLAGTYALAYAPGNEPLLAVAVLGWALLPAPALVYTARGVAPDAAPRVYDAGAALCVLGAGLYAAWLLGAAVGSPLPGLAAVGAGQTAGILNAVYQY